MSEPTSPQIISSSRIGWTLAAFLACLWLAVLGSRPLFNPDEGRYAEIPREMLSSGDWVIPHLNGLAYIEKPPLQYWVTALSLWLLGPTAFAARLYTGLAALGAIAMASLLARRLAGPAAGWCAAAVLAGMLLFALLGQLLTLDMSLTLWMTVSLAAFVLAQRAAEGSNAKGASDAKNRAARPWMLLAWSATGLGVLTKGLVAAAIPVAVLVLYSLVARDVRPWRRLWVSWGLPFFLVITVPWHWLAARRLPDFLQFFFVREHLARYLTPVSDREESWWFFGGMLLLGSLPWTLPTLRVLAGGWRGRPAKEGFNAAQFLWIWIVFVVVFFSLSDSKLMPYILPAMPALAVSIALLPAAALARYFRFTAMLTVAAGLSLGLVSFNWAAVLASSDRRSYFLPLSRPLGEIAALLTVSGLFVLVQRSREPLRAAIFLGAGWCLAWLLIARAAAVVAPIYSGLQLAAAIPPAERLAPIYSIGIYDQTVPFYLGRTVELVSYRGELDYGLGRSPEAEIPEVSDFLPLWSAKLEGFAIMERTLFNELKSRGVPMREVGRNANRVVAARGIATANPSGTVNPAGTANPSGADNPDGTAGRIEAVRP